MPDIVPTSSFAAGSEQALAALHTFIRRHPRLLVLTGAGVSTDSGIPDYRDARGQWKRTPPILHQEFMQDETLRKRFWARSLVGWRLMRQAQPNSTHHALTRLEQQGYVHQLVTQNVDGLHQRAGSRQVIDLHGRIDTLLCMDCAGRFPRDPIYEQMARENGDYAALDATIAPDGDADLERDFSRFQPPVCPDCQGLLKPDVVFYGDNVPRDRVSQSMQALQDAEALLVVGSSLMVFSGFRFCHRARDWGKPIALLNQGVTRADRLAHLKIKAACGDILQKVCERL